MQHNSLQTIVSPCSLDDTSVLEEKAPADDVTALQKARIEQNRLKALQVRRAKQQAQDQKAVYVS